MASSSTMPSTNKTTKRSLRNISANRKLAAIQRVHDGESKASVARDIGVPESTLRGWCKNETKITYLSRQSSPETDSSLEPPEKRARTEEPMEPFNLCTKNLYTPRCESLYTPMDFSKNDADTAPKTPQNLSLKNEIPKSTASQERNRVELERNRAELARLSVELGLNRPEMFNINNANIAEIAASMTYLNQWNLLIQQNQQLQQQKKTQQPATSPGTPATASTSHRQPTVKPPREQQSSEEYIQNWLKAQEATLLSQRANGVSSMAGSNSLQLWNTYSQTLFPQVPSIGDQAILYKQLMKDSKDAENLTVEKSPRSPKRMKSTLDNLLLYNNNNNNNNNNNIENRTDMSQTEAVEHGEKFLNWLESSYSSPSVTAVQIMQLKKLLDKVKGTPRRNGEPQHKSKVRRK